MYLTWPCWADVPYANMDNTKDICQEQQNCGCCTFSVNTSTVVFYEETLFFPDKLLMCPWMVTCWSVCCDKVTQPFCGYKYMYTHMGQVASVLLAERIWGSSGFNVYIYKKKCFYRSVFILTFISPVSARRPWTWRTAAYLAPTGISSVPRTSRWCADFWVTRASRWWWRSCWRSWKAWWVRQLK